MTTIRSRYTPTRRAARRSTPPASSSTSKRRRGRSNEIDEEVSSSSAESEGEEWNSKNDTPKIQQKWGRTKEAGGSRARSEDSDDKPMARKGLRSRSRSRSNGKKTTESRRRVQVKEEDEEEEEEESILSSEDELLLRAEDVLVTQGTASTGKRGPVTYEGRGRRRHKATLAPEDDDDPEHDEDPEKGKPEDGEQDEAENDANANTEDEAEPQITETHEPTIDIAPLPVRQGRIRRAPDRYKPEEQVGHRRDSKNKTKIKSEPTHPPILGPRRNRQSSDTSTLISGTSGGMLDDAIARSKRVLKAAKDGEDEGREAAPSPDSTPAPPEHQGRDQETIDCDLENGRHDQRQAEPSGTAFSSKANPDPGARQISKSAMKRTRSILSINDNDNDNNAESSSPKKKKEVKIDTKNLSIRLITPSTSSGSDRIKIASAQFPAPARGRGGRRGSRGGKRKAVPRTAYAQTPERPLVHPKRKHSNWNLAQATRRSPRERMEAALLAFAEPSTYTTTTSTSSDIDPPRRDFVVSSSSSSGSTSRQGVDASIKGPRPRSFSRLRARSGLFSRYPGLDLLARAGEVEKIREAEGVVDDCKGSGQSRIKTLALAQDPEDRSTARHDQIPGQGPMYSDLVNLKEKGDDQWDRLIALTDCTLDVWAKKHKTILKQVEIIKPPIHPLNTDEIDICGVAEAEADGTATNSNSNTSTGTGIGVDIDVDTRGEEISDPALIQRPGLDFQESLRRLMADYQARVDRRALGPGPDEARGRAPAFSPTPSFGAVGTSSS